MKTNVATASYTGSSEWLSSATGCGSALGPGQTDTLSAWARLFVACGRASIVADVSQTR